MKKQQETKHNHNKW